MDRTASVDLMSGAFWFDGPMDDVPLINVNGAFPAGLDLFDATLPVVTLPEAPSSMTPQPEPQKKKKRPLTKVEKARLEREKNREIQARYRTRQKEKRANLLAEHETATADLERLREEHVRLQQRNTLLESVLTVRDAAVAILDEAQQESPRPEDPAMYDLNSGAFWAGAAVGGSHGTMIVRAPSAVITELREADEGMEEEGCPQEGQLVLSQAGPQDNVEGMAQPIQVPAAVIEKAKNMTFEEYHRNWQEFVMCLRDILAQYDLTNNPQALADLEPLLKRRAVVMTLMLQHNPGCIKTLFVRSGEQGLSEKQQQEYWDGLVAAMQITPLQRERYMHLWDLYLRKVERLRASRNNALTLIGKASYGSLSDPAGLGGMMAQYLQLLEGAARLSSYPDSEFMALLELLNGIGRIIMPLQKARMASWSYPNFPDILQVMQAIQRLPASRQEAGLGQ